MNVAVTIPDEYLVGQGNISREVLEAYAVESFRLERLSFGQLRELLGLAVDEANALLKKHKVVNPMTRDDLEVSRKNIEKFLRKC